MLGNRDTEQMTEVIPVRVTVCAEADVAVITATEPPGADYAAVTFAAQARGRCAYLVAWIGGQPVGSGELEWAAVPELKNLQVREGLRGAGVGTAVIGAAHALASARGMNAVDIGVGVDNPDARRLYERLGYRTTGRFETYTYEYVDREGDRRSATETAEYLRADLVRDEHSTGRIAAARS